MNQKQTLPRDPKWDAIVRTLSEGLTEKQAANFKILAENTAREYVNHARRQANAGGLMMLKENASAGAISASNIGSLVKVILPVMRRAMPTTLTPNIVGTVAMESPVAQIASLRPVYGTTSAGAGTVAGEEMLAPLHVRSFAAAYSGNEVASLPSGAPVAKHEGVLGNSVTLTVLKQTVEAQTRRLQTRITQEALMDAESQYGLDLAATSIEYMANEIAVAIDQEILHTLRSIAPVPGPSSTFDQALVSGTPNSVVDEHAALAVLIQKAAMKVAAKTRIGAANWAVLNPALVTVLQSARASTLARTTSAGDKGFNAPTTGNYVGRLNGTMDVYADVFANDSTPAIVGLKVDETNAPLILAQYVPISTVTENGGMIDPNTGESVFGMYSRYATITFTDVATSLGNSSDYLETIGVNAANLAFI